MPTARRLSRGALLVGAGAALAGLLTAPPATAAGPRTTVTIVLNAPHPARLAQLAVASGRDHEQRVADLAKVLPSAAAHRIVGSMLRTDGFAIGHETAWTIEASAPASVVQGVFGSGSAVGRGRARGVLPAIPAAIAGVTAAVLTSQGAAPLFGAHASLDGSDFRNAYSAPRQSPVEGSDRNGPLTIATLQFANWNESDLSQYAAQPSVNIKPDPVASGQYKQFGVAGSKTSPATDSLDEEVDLDQESLLSTAPHAKQRAYFDTNSSNGYVQALSQVLADVTQGKGKSSDGGDPHIVALSTSWGACEDDFSTSFRGDTMKTVEPLLQSLNAAGVTIFAASGDDGIYDCGHGTSSKIAVDYPASSPSVVAVGGTKLTSPGGSAANDGTNWVDTGWTCKDTTACESAKGTGGSGGGESGAFPMPSYQSAGIGRQPFGTGTGHKGDFGAEPHRLVPDVAVDAAPSTGFKILTTDKDATCPNPLNVFCNPMSNPVNLVVGGTSLSSPLAAALFTNMLATHSATSGVGDIHGALYSAYAAKKGAFRDVTSGRNGSQADVDGHAPGSAAELPTKAQVGFDTVTGLGAPLWPLLAPYLFSPQPPTAHAAMVLASPHSTRRHNVVKLSWHPGRSRHSSLLAADASVVVTRVGDATPVYHRAHAPATGSATFTGVAGGNYVLTVSERDIADDRSAPVSTVLVVPFDSTAFRVQGAWSTTRAGNDFGGSHIQSDTKNAAAKVTARGRQYVLAVRVGPTYGKLAVFRGRTRIKTIDLFNAAPGHRLIKFYGSASARRKARTFTFRCVAKHGPFTNKSTVDIDALDAID